MKFTHFKRIGAVALVTALSISLSACSKADFNTEVPYGTINGNYATLGSNTLTNQSLYNQLRSKGFNVFMSEVEEILLKDYLNKIDYNNEEHQEEMQTIVNTMVFGTDDMEKINAMQTSDQDKLILQLVDSLYVSGIVISTTDITINEDSVTYPTSVYDFFKIDLAKQLFGEAELNKVVDLEEIVDPSTEDDDEPKMMDNPNYISDKDIENYYNNTYITKKDFNAVIVGFNSIKDYRAAVSGMTVPNNDSTDTAKESFFTSLYNKQYSYKTQLNSTNFQEETIVNSEILAGYNSSLTAFLTTMEAGNVTTSYKEFGDKVYMIYKISDIDETKYADLDATVQAEVKDEIYEELFDSKLTSSYITNEFTKMVNDFVEEGKIAIYDPVFAINFSSIYDYELNKEFNKDYVAEVNGIKITPQSLFEGLADFFAIPTTLDYFTYIAIANDTTIINKLTDAEIKKAKEAYDAEIKAFKNDSYYSSGISKEFTEEQFLQLKYGWSTKDEVIKYYFEPLQAKHYYTSTYNETYFNLLEATGKNNYEQYFNLEIKHVLLYVDYDLDGNMDDPEEFMNKLSGSQKDQFQQDILRIYSTIYDELEVSTLGYEKGLDRIVVAYNNNEDLLSSNLNWGDIKGNFNIQMKVESLGVIDTSSASNYVEPFSNHVRDMYNNIFEQAVEECETPTTDDDYQKDLEKVFKELLDTETLEHVVHGEVSGNTSFEELCQSTFGFHLLLSLGGDLASNAKFTEDDDQKITSKDEYMAYEHIEITLNDEDITVNAYSENLYPSVNQLKIYVAEKNTDDGIESLQSKVETIIDGFYSTFTSRYENASFVGCLLFNELNLKSISFTDQTLTNRLLETYEINKRNIDSYKDNSTSAYAGWWAILEA